jgi:hypothetical protein
VLEWRWAARVGDDVAGVVGTLEEPCAWSAAYNHVWDALAVLNLVVGIDELTAGGNGDTRLRNVLVTVETSVPVEERLMTRHTCMSPF